MLKIIAKFILSLTMLVIIVLFYIENLQLDEKVLIAFFASLGATILTGTDLWDTIYADKRYYQKNYTRYNRDYKC